MKIGDKIMLRKKHACGGDKWEVWRIGMNIGIGCLKCGRKLKIARSELKKVVRESESSDKL